MVGNEGRGAADRNYMNCFYSGLNKAWSPQTKQPVHMKSFDRVETFSDSKSGVARWSEYFQKFINVPGDIELEALEIIETNYG